MAISYPVDVPTDPKPSSIVWREVNVVAVSTSPFTLQQQVLDWGDGWAVDVSIDSRDREDMAPWVAFLSSLRGRHGTFRFGDTLTATPLGAAGGTPLVNGASQTGYELISDGWPNSTLVLKASDRIQVDNSLYRVTADVTSDGSGNATIDLWPALRGHANNAGITTASAKGVFRLAGPEIREPIGRSQLWTIGFTAVEAL